VSASENDQRGFVDRWREARGRTPESQREAERRFAAGENRHWEPATMEVRSRSAVLRSFEPDLAVLDVVCVQRANRRRLVARVLREEDGSHSIAAEPLLRPAVRGMSELEAALRLADMMLDPDAPAEDEEEYASEVQTDGGYAVVLVPVGDGLTVGCRCKKIHSLDGARLQSEAMRHRPGKPGEVSVTEVATP
jgi:hypothetical protein